MISEKELNKLKKLAKLDFPKKDEDIIVQKLSSILDMVGSISELDCDSVESFTSPHVDLQHFRKDSVEKTNKTQDLFNNIGHDKKSQVSELSCFVVPKVIE